jgi:hypothetical protein
MKCPKCKSEMEPGYAMAVVGSALRWYSQSEKQHKVLGVLGGKIIVQATMTNEYLSAHRCFSCDGIFISLSIESSDYDRSSIEKAE